MSALSRKAAFFSVLALMVSVCLVPLYMYANADPGGDVQGSGTAAKTETKKREEDCKKLIDPKTGLSKGLPQGKPILTSGTGNITENVADAPLNDSYVCVAGGMTIVYEQAVPLNNKCKPARASKKYYCTQAGWQQAPNNLFPNPSSITPIATTPTLPQSTYVPPTPTVTPGTLPTIPSGNAYDPFTVFGLPTPENPTFPDNPDINYIDQIANPTPEFPSDLPNNYIPAFTPTDFRTGELGEPSTLFPGMTVGEVNPDCGLSCAGQPGSTFSPTDPAPLEEKPWSITQWMRSAWCELSPFAACGLAAEPLKAGGPMTYTFKGEDGQTYELPVSSETILDPNKGTTFGDLQKILTEGGYDDPSKISEEQLKSLGVDPYKIPIAYSQVDGDGKTSGYETTLGDLTDTLKKAPEDPTVQALAGPSGSLEPISETTEVKPLGKVGISYAAGEIMRNNGLTEGSLDGAKEAKLPIPPGANPADVWDAAKAAGLKGDLVIIDPEHGKALVLDTGSVRTQPVVVVADAGYGRLLGQDLGQDVADSLKARGFSDDAQLKAADFIRQNNNDSGWWDQTRKNLVDGFWGTKPSLNEYALNRQIYQITPVEITNQVTPPEPEPVPPTPEQPLQPAEQPAETEPAENPAPEKPAVEKPAEEKPAEAKPVEKPLEAPPEKPATPSPVKPTPVPVAAAPSPARPAPASPFNPTNPVDPFSILNLLGKMFPASYSSPAPGSQGPTAFSPFGQDNFCTNPANPMRTQNPSMFASICNPQPGATNPNPVVPSTQIGASEKPIILVFGNGASSIPEAPGITKKGECATEEECDEEELMREAMERGFNPVTQLNGGRMALGGPKDETKPGAGAKPSEPPKGPPIALRGITAEHPGLPAKTLPPAATTPLAAGADGKINPVAFFQRAQYKIANSGLNGKIPGQAPDPTTGRQPITMGGLGVNTGSAAEWARLFTMIQQQESGHKVGAVAADGSLQKFPTTPAGECSYGPGQFCVNEYGLNSWADVNNPDKVIDAYIKVAESGNLFKNFGSLRRPTETTGHSDWFSKNIAPNVDKNILPAVGVGDPRYRGGPTPTPHAGMEKLGIDGMVPTPTSGEMPKGRQYSDPTSGSKFTCVLEGQEKCDAAAARQALILRNPNLPPGSKTGEFTANPTGKTQLAKGPVTTEPRLYGAGGQKSSIPSSMHPVMKAAMTEASKYLPQGYSAWVEGCEGHRASGTSYHQKSDGQGALACDIGIRDERGDKIEWLKGGDPRSYPVYKQFMQDTKHFQDKMFPNMAGAGRWGGYFLSGVSRDWMHYDLGPANGTVAGNWQSGMFPQFAGGLDPAALAKGGMGDMGSYQPGGANPLPTYDIYQTNEKGEKVLLAEAVGLPVGTVPQSCTADCPIELITNAEGKPLGADGKPVEKDGTALPITEKTLPKPSPDPTDPSKSIFPDDRPTQPPPSSPYTGRPGAPGSSPAERAMSAMQQALGQLGDALKSLLGQQQQEPKKECRSVPRPSETLCTSGSWLPEQTPDGCTQSWKCTPTQANTANAQITCTPKLVDKDSPVTISYKCLNATQSSGTGFSTGGALSGTTTVKASATSTTQTFTLTCTKSGLTTSAQCTVQVAKPAIILVANPKTVEFGLTSTIGWITAGMKSCTVSSPEQADFTQRNSTLTTINGSATTSPIRGLANFALTCTTIAGNIKSATTSVTGR